MNPYYAVILASIAATLFRLVLLWTLAVPYMQAHDSIETRGTVYTVLAGLELAVFGLVWLRLVRWRPSLSAYDRAAPTVSAWGGRARL